MSATITALRPGRTVALVQRKRRRMHLASIGAGEIAWQSFCDRDVLAAGAAISNPDVATALEDYGHELCSHCFRLLALALYVTAIHTPATAERHYGIAR